MRLCKCDVDMHKWSVVNCLGFWFERCEIQQIANKNVNKAKKKKVE